MESRESRRGARSRCQYWCRFAVAVPDGGPGAPARCPVPVPVPVPVPGARCRAVRRGGAERVLGPRRLSRRTGVCLFTVPATGSHHRSTGPASGQGRGPGSRSGGVGNGGGPVPRRRGSTGAAGTDPPGSSRERIRGGDPRPTAPWIFGKIRPRLAGTRPPPPPCPTGPGAAGAGNGERLQRGPDVPGPAGRTGGGGRRGTGAGRGSGSPPPAPPRRCGTPGSPPRAPPGRAPALAAPRRGAKPLPTAPARASSREGPRLSREKGSGPRRGGGYRGGVRGRARGPWAPVGGDALPFGRHPPPAAPGPRPGDAAAKGGCPGGGEGDEGGRGLRGRGGADICSREGRGAGCAGGCRSRWRGRGLGLIPGIFVSPVPSRPRRREGMREAARLLRYGPAPQCGPELGAWPRCKAPVKGFGARSR